MANVLDKLNELKDVAKEKYDKVSTVVYKKVREGKEYVDNSFNGKKKAKDEMSSEKEYEADMKKQLFGDDEAFFKEYQIQEDGLSYDSNRSEFSVIDKNVYEDPTKISTGVEDIEAYLTKTDEKNFFDAKKNKKEKEIVYDPERLQKTQKLKEEFESNKIFNFEEKNKMLAGKANVASKAAIEKYGLLNRIISAYAGNKEDLAKIKEEPNQTLVKNFSNIVSSYLRGETDERITGNNLFMQMHGVDHTKMPSDMDTEKLVSLCALAENHQNPEQFTGLSTKTIENINDLIITGNTNPEKIALEQSIDSIIEDTLTKGDQMKDLQTRSDGPVDTIYFSNEGEGIVDVLHISTDEKLVARYDDNEKAYIEGSRENIANAFKMDITTKEALSNDKDELTKKIEVYRETTEIEALTNPMSKEEKAAYDREVQAELDKHNKKVNLSSKHKLTLIR